MVEWIDTKSRRQDFAIKLLEESFRRNENGEPSFVGWGYRTAVALLVDDLKFPQGLASNTLAGIVRNAIWEMARIGSFSDAEMLNCTRNAYISHQRLLPKKFVLLSSVSLYNTTAHARKTWLKHVCFWPPSKYADARAQISDEIEQVIPAAISNRYSRLYVSVAARDMHEAFEQALFQLDLVRAIWNLQINRQYLTRTASGLAQPVNQILRGPIHTLHVPSGALATTIFNYETDYTNIAFPYNWGPTVSSIQTFFLRVERKLQVSPVSDFIKCALVDYVRALDHKENKRAFLDLWSLLERLVGSANPAESKKTTGTRTAFLIGQDVEYVQAVLARLAERRNELVHGRSEAPEMEAALHHIREYVEYAIEFLLQNKYDFQSPHDFKEFLDTPKDVAMLARRLSLMLKGRAHLTPRRKSDEGAEDSETPPTPA